MFVAFLILRYQFSDNITLGNISDHYTVLSYGPKA